jgi:hypothetical protein
MSAIRDLDSIIQQMFDDVPGISYQHKLNNLANCNCCQRHQVNKPTVFTAWFETPCHDIQASHSCTCNCRHVARFICRQADDYTPPPITRHNTPISVIDI